MERPNCHVCVHRDVGPARSVHIGCGHPAVGGKTDFADKAILLAAAVAGRDNRIALAVQILGISADTHGIKNGWFYWPADFDPTWLVSCRGFERVAEPETKEAPA